MTVLAKTQTLCTNYLNKDFEYLIALVPALVHNAQMTDSDLYA